MIQISLLNLIVLNLIIFISLIGYGRLLAKILLVNSNILRDYFSLLFYFGLIFIGSIGIILNFFLPLNDIVSIISISIGLILFLFFRNENFIFKKEILTFIIIISISVLFCYFSVVNDDYDYHFNTIENFKELILINNLLFHPGGGARVSYNSHWLMLNAITYLSFLPVTLYSISSLIFASTLFDFFKSLQRNLLKKNNLAVVYGTLVLLFLIGVLNSYKEYGTDFPGQLIIATIILIFFEYYKDFLENKENFKINIYITLLLLSLLAFSIKISNVFIIFLLFVIFLKLKIKIKVFTLSIISLLPLCLWLFQNFVISKCLLWPIHLTCFENVDFAIKEKFIIEATAKGVIEGFGEPTELISNFNWIPIWMNDHFYKIVETYGFYSLLLAIPLIIFRLKKNTSIENNLNKYIYFFKNKSFLIFSILSLFCSTIWFLQAPVHRFAIIYNLNFILIIFIPFWIRLLIIDYKFYLKSIKILFSIAVIFFSIEMFSKYNKYVSRHGYIWPNVKEGILYEKIVPN